MGRAACVRLRAWVLLRLQGPAAVCAWELLCRVLLLCALGSAGAVAAGAAGKVVFLSGVYAGAIP